MRPALTAKAEHGDPCTLQGFAVDIFLTLQSHRHTPNGLWPVKRLLARVAQASKKNPAAAQRPMRGLLFSRVCLIRRLRVPAPAAPKKERPEE